MEEVGSGRVEVETCSSMVVVETSLVGEEIYRHMVVEGKVMGGEGEGGGNMSTYGGGGDFTGGGGDL
ncbi:hypothetical protein ACHQM5_028226 [Ranunculus cassubicifolius]